MGCEPSAISQQQYIRSFKPDFENADIQTHQFLIAKTHRILDEYQFLNYLNRGSRSYIRKARHLKSGIERVVKVYYRVGNNGDHALNQINAMKILDHPNITRLVEYFIDESNIYLVYEKIEGQELFTHLLGVDDKIRKNFPLIFKQLLLTIQYCHIKGYAHLNIMPESILVSNKNGNYFLKLVGFSQIFEYKEKLAIEDESPISQVSQTNVRKSYRAPEKLSLKEIEKIDIWMAGILLLMVVTGRNLLIQREKQDLFQVIKDWQEENPKFQQLADLMKRMLEKNPRNRFSARQCLDHPFLKQINGEMYRWRMALVYNFLHNFKQKNRLKRLFQISMLHRISSSHDQNEFQMEFSNLDRNKDGVLEREELIEGLLNSYSISKEDAEVYVNEIFQKLDRNNNGFLEYSEFLLGTMRVSKIINEKNIENIFKEMDIDGNGFISTEEIKSMFYDVCLDDDLFQDKRGMSLPEFKSLMMELSYQKT